MKKRTKVVLTICIALLLAVGGYLAGFFGLGNQLLPQRSENASANRPVPTIFVHGYGGTPASSNMLINRVEHDGYGQRAMRATVSKNGKVTYTGSIKHGQVHPLVQVIFKDNTQGDYHLAASWVGKVVNHLHRQYGVTNYNAVAHSYGNNAVVYYAATHKTHPAKLDKVVNIASDIGMDPEEHKMIKSSRVPADFRQAVREMVKDESWFDGNHSPFNGRRMQALNIYGTYRKGTDGTISNYSSRDLRRTYHGINGTYRELNVKGHLAQHSALTRYNPQVAQAVSQFLKE